MSESSSAASLATEISLNESTHSGGGSTVVLPPPASVRRRHRGVGWRARAEITLLSGPAIIIFLLFVIVPVFVALYYSFFAWKGYGPATNFIGFGNYKYTLTNPDFWKAVEHNGIIIVLSLGMQGPLAILVALLLNQKMRGRSLIRVLVFLPWVVSEAIAGVGFRLMLGGASPALSGLLTKIGHLFGASGTVNVPWLSSTHLSIWTLMFILTWKYIGYAIILMLAGLQGIPEELSEAAAVDGASYWQIQRHIMLPLLSPTIRVWAFLSIIGSLQLFDIIFVIWGQYNAATFGVSTMVYFLTNNGRMASQLGRGSAISIVVFVISLIIAIVYQRFVLRRDTEGAITDESGE